MDNKQTADLLLSTLEDAFGIKAKLGNHNLCSILQKSSGNNITIELPYAGNNLHIYTSIFSIPFENRENFFEFLLKLNLHGLETHGNILGIDTQTQKVILCRVLELNKIKEEEFPAIFKNFIDSTETLKNQLTRFIQSNSGKSNNTLISKPLHMIV